MAGAVGIVFGLCMLSFTLGAALMYVLVRRKEEAASGDASAPEVPALSDTRTWVSKPLAVEPVDDAYDTRPIHRNPVMGLRQLEPALAVPAHPAVAKPKAKPESVAMPKPVATPEPAAKPESVAMPESVAKPKPVAKPEPVAEPTALAEPEPVAEPEAASAPGTVGAAGYD